MGAQLPIGSIFAGRFRLIRVVGQGGMGVVYLAEHAIMGRQVALKVLHAEGQHDAKSISRFRREARAACRVMHQHVTTVHDFGHDEEQVPYLVMEYVEGPTLGDLVQALGPLPMPRLVNILAQIAAGLTEAHRCRVIHRDLKPGNVVLTTHDGHRDWVKLMDFGMAKILDPDETTGLSVTGAVMGTPMYMSPEQVSGDRLDAMTDIYSFGVLAFELITGHLPFQGGLQDIMRAHILADPPSPSQASDRKDVPPGLEELVLACLAKLTGDRPANAEVLVQRLHNL